MNLAEQIQAELQRAHQLDLEANAKRKEAGTLLCRARTDLKHYHQLLRELDIDHRSAELLVELACGSRPVV